MLADGINLDDYNRHIDDEFIMRLKKLYAMYDRGIETKLV